jgi:hypothetical protein
MSDFNNAIKNIDLLRPHLKQGLQALGASSKKVQAEHPKTITGSVDLDSALQKEYPEKNRWDYAIGYRPSVPRQGKKGKTPDRVLFLEVHPANGHEVTVVIQKKRALQEWMANESQAVTLNGLRRRFVWAASGKNGIPARGTYLNRLAQAGINFEARVVKLEG